MQLNAVEVVPGFLPETWTLGVNSVNAAGWWHGKSTLQVIMEHTINISRDSNRKPDTHLPDVWIKDKKSLFLFLIVGVFFFKYNHKKKTLRCIWIGSMHCVSVDSGGFQLNSLTGCALNKLASTAAVGQSHHAPITLHLTDFLKETDIISRAHVVFSPLLLTSRETMWCEVALCAHGNPAA